MNKNIIALAFAGLYPEVSVTAWNPPRGASPARAPGKNDRMDWSTELMLVGRAAGAMVLGGLVGIDRQAHGSVAGVRTFAAVSLGACVFSLIPFHVGTAAPGGDTRLAAAVVSGLGFLGAGLILKEGPNIRGLTTAATLWATASVGMLMACGMYVLAIATTAMLCLLLMLHRVPFLRGLLPHGPAPTEHPEDGPPPKGDSPRP